MKQAEGFRWIVSYIIFQLFWKTYLFGVVYFDLKKQNEMKNL